MRIISILLLVVLCNSARSQVTISGFVQDEKTSESLIGVHIMEPSSRSGATSNSYGYFSFSLPVESDSIELIISFTGYVSQKIWIEGNSGKHLLVKLKPGIALDEFIVEGSKPKSFQMGKTILPLHKIESYPSFLGESDILRSFQLMPGIHSGKEGTAGIHVRGGSPDQNLILLDDIPLYYVNHIGGFFSVFNTDALKSAELYRGAFPARYGGRISSVIDIRSKDGNMKEFKGIITAGIVSSKIMLEGPLIKEKASFLVSARRSLLDAFTRAYYKLNSTDNFTAGYNLYDLNGKVNYVFSETDRVYFSWYSGRDRIFANQKDLNKLSDSPYTYLSTNSLSWGNQSASLRWNHIFSKKLFSNITFGRTNFFYDSQRIVKRKDKTSGELNGKLENILNSGILDYLLKVEADLFLESHHISFGAGSTFHRFTPTSLAFSNLQGNLNIQDDIERHEMIRATTSFAYVSDKFEPWEKLTLDLGLHFSLFAIPSRRYFSPEPRLTASWKMNNLFMLKTSYVRMMQPVHLLSARENGIPTDLWVPSTEQVAPQRSDMVSIGFAGELSKKHNFSVDIEAFYKNFTGLIDMREGSSFFSGDSNWQEKVETEGTGKAWGIEILLQKNKGKYSGFVSYTFSRTERTFENINQGDAYPYKYDKPHDFSIYIKREINESTDLSATWVFSSGFPTTVPFERYFIYGMDPDNDQISDAGPGFGQVHLYSKRNNYRFPTYHRLDLNINFRKRLKSGSRIWSLGLYNAYNHHNTYTVFFERKNDGKIRLYSLSLFPVIPSISYSYRF